MDRDIVWGSRVLCFDPADPNVMCRLQQVMGQLGDIRSAMESAADPITALWEADRRLKEGLGWALGCDLEAVTGGKSLFAMEDGRSLLEGLLDALAPALEQGARDWALAQRERYGAL